MLTKIFVITAGVSVLLAAVVLLHAAIKQVMAARWQTVAVRAYAFLALLGGLQFCIDLYVYRRLWNDDSWVMALLNFIGIIMLDIAYLLPLLLGCLLFYFWKKYGPATRPSAAN